MEKAENCTHISGNKIDRFQIVATCGPFDYTLYTANKIGDLTDGYHTFNELYAHRIELFIALCRLYEKLHPKWHECWRSTKHSDGSLIPGWFVMGLYYAPGLQITYRIPDERWGDCDFAETLEQAPEFDGHTPADVLERLKKL